MSNLIELTKDQQIAYARFIKARNKVFYGDAWVRPSKFGECVYVEGMNHPLFPINDVYVDYLEAFQAWLDIEPKSRQENRMRASRGDFGTSDSWEERAGRVSDVANKMGSE